MEIHRTQDYYSCFDPRTGDYYRTGLLVNGVETDKDPFMAPFPELLDIGIMGHCGHGQQGLCPVGCYQNGPHVSQPNMSLEDIQDILRQSRGKVFQIALGGRGDPDQHEDFAAILAACRENRIVPNYTTSGLGMTPHLAELTRAYCGAAAVSWYRGPYTLRAIRLLLEQDARTNVHYVLSKSTLREALLRLKRTFPGQMPGFPDGINAVVFLLHKPVGLGSREEMLSADMPEFREFLEIVDNWDGPHKIGFDSCTVPALLGMKNIDPAGLDTCEGGRWSAYISADLQMMPCSFGTANGRWTVDLRTHTMQDAWGSPVFEDFRTHLRVRCPGCPQQAFCMGGCPIVPEITLCQRKEKDT